MTTNQALFERKSQFFTQRHVVFIKRHVPFVKRQMDFVKRHVPFLLGYVPFYFGNVDFVLGNVPFSFGNVDFVLGNVPFSFGNVDFVLGNVPFSFWNVDFVLGYVDLSLGNVDLALGQMSFSFGNVDFVLAQMPFEENDDDFVFGGLVAKILAFARFFRRLQMAGKYEIFLSGVAIFARKIILSRRFMFSLIVGVIMIAFAVFACLPSCLDWMAFVIDFLKGAVPVFAALAGLLAIFIGFADIKDKAEARREEAESKAAEDSAKN